MTGRGNRTKCLVGLAAALAAAAGLFFALQPRPEPDVPPAARCHAKYEARFPPASLGLTAPRDPYDPDAIAVDARVTTPSGKRLAVPCFWLVPQERYFEMDLKDWILGPYLETAVEEMAMPRVHGDFFDSRARYAEEVSRIVLPVIGHLGRLANSEKRAILELVRKHRNQMIDRMQSHFLEIGRSGLDGLETNLHSIRRTAYEALMNDLCLSVILLADSGKFRRKLIRGEKGAPKGTS